MRDLKVTLPEPCNERWETMSRQGCNRICDRCSTTIHDLSQLTVGEVQALLASSERICVRAQLDRTGLVQTKPEPRTSARRVIATVGLSVALMTQSGQALAKDKQPTGAIFGMVAGAWTGK